MGAGASLLPPDGDSLLTETVPVTTVTLKGLPDAIDEVVYSKEKWVRLDTEGDWMGGGARRVTSDDAIR